MLDGKAAIFISSSEKYKEQVAYPFRDVIQTLGIRAIIVSDAPKLVNTWTPDEKVEAYLDRSDGMLVLGTPDNQLANGTWETRQNIIDEIARARSKPHLRDRICVLKESSVRLPSNINPVYDNLDLQNLQSAFEVFLSQLKEWGFDVPDIDEQLQSQPSRNQVGLELVEGLRFDDPARTTEYVRRMFFGFDKREQQNFINQALTVLQGADHWERRAVAAQIFEAVVEIDANFITVDLLEEFSHHEDFSVRSSCAIVLFILASMAPGRVPIDIVARLARPTSEDWYVYTPALNALKQLAITRPEAVAVLVTLSRSSHRDDREYAISAFRDIAKIRPELIPPEAIVRLRKDDDPVIAEMTEEVRASIEGVSEVDRGHPYSPFTPF